MLLESNSSTNISVEDTNVFSLVTSQNNTNGSKSLVITDQVTLIAGEPKLRICRAGSTNGKKQNCFTTESLPYGKFINFRIRKWYFFPDQDIEPYFYTLTMSEDAQNPGKAIVADSVWNRYDDVDIIFGRLLEPANVYVKNFNPLVMQDDGNWFIL